ncbi:hypothetical protein JGU66_14735 [Myxococcaceae bacterium JPH2]|nr:hypothetical protein [Myxococcaceae bacterium JPH2]
MAIDSKGSGSGGQNMVDPKDVPPEKNPGLVATSPTSSGKVRSHGASTPTSGA